MTLLFRIFVMAACLLIGLETEAKKIVPVEKMYMFGMAASFTDTIVHFTPIQQVDSAWIDHKSKFLQDRDSYSLQLRTYLQEKKGMAQRTCIVVYSQNMKKLEKKYAKMKRLYAQPKKGGRRYNIRDIADSDFHFQTVKAIPFVEEEHTETADSKPAKKEKRKKKSGK